MLEKLVNDLNLYICLVILGMVVRVVTITLVLCDASLLIIPDLQS